MAFIKRHLMLLLCGLLGVLSLAGIALGILVGDVSAEMQEAEALSRKLGGMSRDCVNNEHIKQAQDKARKISADYERVDKIVKTMNGRQPLRDGVFPMPRRASDAYGFREAYRQALDNLLPNVLKARSAPTSEEVRRMQLLIAKEKADAAKKGQSVGPGAPGAGAVVFPAPGGRPGEPGKAAGPTVEELAKTDAEVRMSLVRAHETLCYAEPQCLSVLQILLDSKDVPEPEQMWDAQMSLWIQQDVLGALAKVNDAAAAKLKPDDRWVAYMPVKEVIAIRIGDYVLGPGAAEAAGAAAASKWVETAADPAAPPGDASVVFTNRTSNELYDVIHFAVELVIDARDLPTVLDAISGANFYTPLTVSCSAPAVIPSFRGKVYGPDPVLRVRIEFEGCFFREFYHYKDGKEATDENRLMPKSLSDQILNNKLLARDKLSPWAPPGMGTPR